MIRIGFNLLLFVVLLILFIGYCWTIIIERDYNTKIEKFNININSLTQKSDAPIDINSQKINNKSTPESLDDAFCKQRKSKKYTSKINVCNTSQLLPSKIPSIAQVNNNNRWRYNDFHDDSYPESGFMIPYIPSSNTPKLYTNDTNTDSNTNISNICSK